MSTAIENLKTCNRRGSIGYREQVKIPLHIPIDISHGAVGSIVATKINQNDLSQSFRVEMSKGAIWEQHSHDCLETIIVYKGNLHEHLECAAANKYCPLILKPYKEHLIEAMSKSIFYVEFINPRS